MYICCVGDLHGKINKMYEEIQAFEDRLDVIFSYILQVGDFGIWTKDSIVDRATKNHGDVGDFPAKYEQKIPVPVPTFFVKGNHEDFEFLSLFKLDNKIVLPRLHYLSNGSRVKLGINDPVVIGGIGGCYGYSSYDRKDLKQCKQRHYTKVEIENLIKEGPIDIFITHDAPHNLEFKGFGRTYKAEATGLENVVKECRPKLWIFGHHHSHIITEIEDTLVVGLSKIGNYGNMAAVEVVKDRVDVLEIV